MEINDFLGIGIIGAVASVIIEVLKRKTGTAPIGSKFTAIIVSVVLGTLYFYVRNTPWFPTVVSVLGAASTIYALFFPKNS